MARSIVPAITRSIAEMMRAAPSGRSVSARAARPGACDRIDIVLEPPTVVGWPRAIRRILSGDKPRPIAERMRWLVQSADGAVQDFRPAITTHCSRSSQDVCWTSWKAVEYRRAFLHICSDRRAGWTDGGGWRALFAA